jgi:hypothetical protein
MIVMGQMEAASPIFENLFLGTEWNAQNADELEARKYVQMYYYDFILDI